MPPGPNADRYPQRWETPESVFDRERPRLPQSGDDREVPLLPPPTVTPPPPRSP
jgi:hypothetical protein